VAKEYYCRNCAMQHNLIFKPPTGKVVGSKKHIEKHKKHTGVNPNEPILGVFLDLSTETYRHLFLDAWENGGVEIGDKGETNLVWAAGEYIGDVHRFSELVGPTEVIKVVLTSDLEKTHAYPVSKSDYNDKTCLDCGRGFVNSLSEY